VFVVGVGVFGGGYVVDVLVGEFVVLWLGFYFEVYVVGVVFVVVCGVGVFMFDEDLYDFDYFWDVFGCLWFICCG